MRKVWTKMCKKFICEESLNKYVKWCQNDVKLMSKWCQNDVKWCKNISNDVKIWLVLLIGSKMHKLTERYESDDDDDDDESDKHL